MTRIEVIIIQASLLDPEDAVLFGAELLIVIGLAISIILAYQVKKHHSAIAAGWNLMLFGLIFLFLHSLFDMLDTLQFDDLIVDMLQLLDGSTFVIGLLMFAFGIYRIANFGAKKWGL